MSRLSAGPVGQTPWSARAPWTRLYRTTTTHQPPPTSHGERSSPPNMPREHLLKIGVSGIRGVVGDFLTPGLACAFAQAFGTYVGAGRVVVGRDTRSSGEMFHHAVACGLLAAGCEVVDIGILPTPTIQIYVGATRARGGIAITASHNPPEYNALKLFNSEG